MSEDKDIVLIMHVVLGENEHTKRLAEMLAKRGRGTVTLVDAKYSGLERKGDVAYMNMDLARHSFDIPDELYFYAYMDPANRISGKDAGPTS